MILSSIAQVTMPAYFSTMGPMTGAEKNDLSMDVMIEIPKGRDAALTAIAESRQRYLQTQAALVR